MVNIQENVSLKNYSNFKIGGNAKYFVSVESVDEIIDALKNWEEISEKFPKEEKRIFVLGGGTNLLISDNGFNGLIIHNDIKFIKAQDQLVTVGAGVLVEDLLNYCMGNSLSGIEWSGGLPGTVGGAVRGNAGAFGGEVKDNIVEVKSIDINTLGVKKRNNIECNFDYRNSIFKTGLPATLSLPRRAEKGKEEIIISAVFKLQKGDRKKLREEIEEKKAYRKNRHPLEYPNIGSIFKNIPAFAKASAGKPSSEIPETILNKFKDSIKNDPFPVLPTAKLIAVSNLKGERVGDAQISEKHPNFIVNLGNAKSDDVLELIKKVKQVIKEKFEISLEEEITILG